MYQVKSELIASFHDHAHRPQTAKRRPSLQTTPKLPAWSASSHVHVFGPTPASQARARLASVAASLQQLHWNCSTLRRPEKQITPHPFVALLLTSR
jgi:hypothetical protein